MKNLLFLLCQSATLFGALSQDVKLLQAAESGNTQDVIQALGDKATVNAQNSSDALMIAAMSGYREIVELLLAYGTQVNAQDEARETALIWAAFKGQKEIVELLLASGADVNAQDNDGWTALMSGVCARHQEIVELLLKAGADAHIKNKYGKMAQDLARETNYQEIASFIAQFSQTIKKFKDELNQAIRTKQNNRIKELIQEIEHEKLNSRLFADEKGNSLLHQAVVYGTLQAIYLVLSAFPQLITAKNQAGETAVNIALGRPEVMKLFIQVGFDQS